MVRYGQRKHPHSQPEPFTVATLAVIMRVAGHVPTEVHAHAIGHREQQVTVRIGDALLYLTDAATAARIRRSWDAHQHSTHRLRQRVSQTWLPVQPGTYPITIARRLTPDVDIDGQYLPADRRRHRPPQLQMRLDQLHFEICDRTAYYTISEAWWAAQRHLDPDTG